MSQINNRKTDIFQLERQRSNQQQITPPLPKINKVLDSKNIDDIFGTNLNQYNVNQQLNKIQNASLSRTRTPQSNNQQSIEHLLPDNTNMMNDLMVEKQQENDRLNRMLIERVQFIENSMIQEIKKQNQSLDYERTYRQRLEQQMQLQEDQQKMTLDSLKQQMENMYVVQQKNINEKRELESKQIQYEQEQREIRMFMSNISKQGSTDLLQFRELIQEKITKDEMNWNKEKEKSKRLFHEMVRLGEVVEKLKDENTVLQDELKQKIRIIEDMMGNDLIQKSRSIEEGKGQVILFRDQQQQQDKKMQQMENNMLLMAQQVQKNDSDINQIDQTNQKLLGDARQLLTNLENDYNSKLQLRVNEIVNRLLIEHNERQREQSELKQQIELRDKLNKDINEFTKEELLERYNNLDNLMRIELRRKEEQLVSLQQMIEYQQQRNKQILQEIENKRIEQENMIRDEILKYQEIQKKEYDMFQNQQTSIQEKITEMIKIEVETRLNTDQDLKNLTNQIAQDMLSNFNNVKGEIQQLLQSQTQSYQNCLQKQSEKSNQLSQYIDQQVQAFQSRIDQKIEKIKGILTKLAEQFKNHLIIYEAYKKDNQQQVQRLENQIQTNYEQTKLNIKQTKEDTDQQIESNKNLVDKNIESVHKVLNDKMEKSQEVIQQEFKLIKDKQLSNNGNIEYQIEKVNTINKEYFQEMGKNINEQIELSQILVEHIQEIERVMQVDSQDIDNKINNILTDLQTKIKDQQESLKGFQQNQDMKWNNNDKIVDVIKKTMNESGVDMTKQINKHQLYIDSINDQQISQQKYLQQLLSSEQFYIDQTSDIIQQQCLRLEQQLQMKNEINGLKEQQLEIVDIQSMSYHDQQNQSQKTNETVIKYQQQLNSLTDNLKNQFGELCDNKIVAQLEKMKKQNQVIWESTLDPKNQNYEKTQQLLNQYQKRTFDEIDIEQDQYQKPQIKQ